MTADPARALRDALGRARLFRTSIRRRDSVCEVCGRQTDAGFRRCYVCNMVHRRSGLGLSDRTGFLICASHDDQSGQVMRSYKAPQPSRMNREMVMWLLLLYWHHHAECPSVMAGAPLTAWATVPSLGGRAGQHPLNEMWSQVMRARADAVPEVRMVGKGTVDPRSLNPDHFELGDKVGLGDHVLLLDDTWASGGHVQSAASALKAAGAGQVSALTIARWFSPGFPKGPWMHESTVEYTPAICPWTLDGSCP